MSKKILFLITATPLNEPGEEFLKTEALILKSHFNKIINIHSAELFFNKTTADQKIEYLYFPHLPNATDKFNYFVLIFTSLFWQELIQLLFKYKLFPSPSRIFSIMGGIAVGNKLKKMILQQSLFFKGSKIYAYSYWCNYIAVGLSLLKTKAPHITCISRAHGYDIYFERNVIRYLPFRKLIYNSLDRVYFISKSGLTYAQEKTGSFPSMRTSCLGCPANEINRCSVNDTFLLVSCSSAVPVKMIHKIILALSIINSRDPIRWIHFGDGPLLNELKALAQNMLTNKRNISFQFMGYVQNAEIIKYYASHNVNLFINVSESEGLPFSIMEAFSCKIPAIAPCVGGTQEIINDTLNGFLLPPNPEPLKIAKTIENYISLSLAEKEDMANNAWGTWRTKFNSDINYKVFIDDFI